MKLPIRNQWRSIVETHPENQYQRQVLRYQRYKVLQLRRHPRSRRRHPQLRARRRTSKRRGVNLSNIAVTILCTPNTVLISYRKSNKAHLYCEICVFKQLQLSCEVQCFRYLTNDCPTSKGSNEKHYSDWNTREFRALLLLPPPHIQTHHFVTLTRMVSTVAKLVIS